MEDYLFCLLYGLTCFSKSMSFKIAYPRQTSRHATSNDSSTDDMTNDCRTKH